MPILCPPPRCDIVANSKYIRISPNIFFFQMVTSIFCQPAQARTIPTPTDVKYLLQVSSPQVSLAQWTVDSASPHCLESTLRPITILRSNLIDSSYQTSHSRNQLKAKQEEDNGDHPTHDFKLPLQNYCQHNAGTISNWAVQSGSNVLFLKVCLLEGKILFQYILP